ncbi:MAG: sigma-70 family RNA polymerase sigma factor [Rhizobiaceae bacterium]
MNTRFDVRPHLDALWRYARVLTRDDPNADDLVQESLTRALSLAKSYDRSRPLKPWLMAIVRNTHATSVARRAREQGRLDAMAHLADDSLQPTQEHALELNDVIRAMDRLPIEQAETLHLVAVSGLSYAEAANVMDVATGTIMSRLSRARSALRHYLEADAEPDKVVLRLVRGSNDG